MKDLSSITGKGLYAIYMRQKPDLYLTDISERVTEKKLFMIRAENKLALITMYEEMFFIFNSVTS